jgi:aryl-alcohol dehydrogenase-like predicted oxidoreductase
MERRQLGKTDMQVSALGFGGAELGFTRADEATFAAVLNDALDAGLNVIDTAECYNDSEEGIGRAVSHRRQDFYLLTKCGHSSGFEAPDWDIAMMEQTIDRSLKRLRTDYVDVLQLHTCSEELLRQGDVIAVLQRARDAGKTRYIGYSGDSLTAKYALECGAFDTLQTSISIADQEAIDLTLPVAREKHIGVIVKRPIANVAWRDRTQPGNDYERPYWERLNQLDYDFLSGDLSLSVQTALRFTLGLPGVHTAIVGTTKPGRWRENAAYAAQGPLSPEQYEAIRARWREVAQPDWTGRA